MESTGEVRLVSTSAETIFGEPVEVVSAYAPNDVPRALSRAEHFVRQGLCAIGFIGYEAATALDRALCTHAPQAGLPVLWLGFYDASEERPPPLPRDEHAASSVVSGDWHPLLGRRDYLDAVTRIREWIAAGHTYQVNYTFPLEAPFCGDPRATFYRLCAVQPSEYAAYVDTGRHVIVSISPELFFDLQGNRLTTRPMKGTRPRGRWSGEDRLLADELTNSPKDRSENAMIVDLLRNDMGRLSAPGSVRVRRFATLEQYPTVWQLTSTITSRTKASVPELLRALFPCGSVTGAPKVRTMEIIRDLELFPRGVYCGAIGRWGPERQARFNVAIRTLTIDREAGRARYPVGGGITWDSSPEDEYRECLAKAAVLSRVPAPRFNLLESLLFEQGAYFLLEEHLSRLAASASYFGRPLDRGALREALLSRPWTRPPTSHDRRLKVRVLVRADGTTQIEAAPLASLGEPRVGLAATPVDPRDVFLYHKTTNREVYDRARAERPDCNDVVLRNDRGEITETSIANLVLELDGERFTPPLDCGLLPGVFRDHLLREGLIEERALTSADLSRADTVWMVNSVRKWTRVRVVE